MKRRSALLSVALVLLIAGVSAYLWKANSDASSSGNSARPEPSGSLADAHESLLDGPRDVYLQLVVDIPKGSESDKPDHQEISAQGIVDFSSRDAELVYDFKGLANVAGYLGHFDTMDVVYADGRGYLRIFIDGPPWVSIEPSDATNSEVARLREMMLTTPMVLPGLLEASAMNPVEVESGSSHEVDPGVLAESEDPVAAGLGEALRSLGVDVLHVSATLREDGVNAVDLSFHYLGPEGETEVKAAFAISASEGEVSVETPDASQVRTFSSIMP